DVDERYIMAFFSDMGEGTQSVCSFVYSEVDIDSEGYGIMLPGFDVKIQSSTFNMNCAVSAGWLLGLTVDASDVTIAAGQGLWIDEDAAFIGDSQIKLTAEDGAAISAASGIIVPDDYDLGGTTIVWLNDVEFGGYYTFAVETGGAWTPASNVEIHSL
ncbi:MAG: hypothetical protein K6T29_08300, partial [Peptococcaceae bacterium]|nr:hypothetical protein [Peptococcaceae bacterium]